MPKITAEELDTAIIELDRENKIDIDALFGIHLNRNQAQHNRNMKRKSKYKGVGKDGLRWRARISYDGRIISLGSFSNEIKAAKAYDEAAKKIYKECACLNFLEGE